MLGGRGKRNKKQIPFLRQKKRWGPHFGSGIWHGITPWSQVLTKPKRSPNSNPNSSATPMRHLLIGVFCHATSHCTVGPISCYFVTRHSLLSRDFSLARVLAPTLTATEKLGLKKKVSYLTPLSLLPFLFEFHISHRSLGSIYIIGPMLSASPNIILDHMLRSLSCHSSIAFCQSSYSSIWVSFLTGS